MPRCRRSGTIASSSWQSQPQSTDPRLWHSISASLKKAGSEHPHTPKCSGHQPRDENPERVDHAAQMRLGGVFGVEPAAVHLLTAVLGGDDHSPTVSHRLGAADVVP